MRHLLMPRSANVARSEGPLVCCDSVERDLRGRFSMKERMGIDSTEDDPPPETLPEGKRQPPDMHPPAPPGPDQGESGGLQPSEPPWESLIRSGKDRGFAAWP